MANEKFKSQRELSSFGWVGVVLITAALLITVTIAGFYTFVVPAMLGMAMLFVGPFYAAYFVPTMVARWREGSRSANATETSDQEPSLNQGTILHFGAINQRATMTLNSVLIVNLIATALYILFDSLNGPNSSEDLFSPVFAFGTVAVVAGIPLIVLNLQWRLNEETVPVESLALRHKLGAWKLIKIHRVMSMVVWCGYPGASILTGVFSVVRNMQTLQ